ncbi:aspartate/glutamate racemase family protein [Streptomyces yangpuensis]|uniref:aspartate racemase/maleate isomerase family protein n=1 Tax=Streptomyces yangpuensis TaxID=1648182 RepID=UPI0037FC00B2
MAPTGVSFHYARLVPASRTTAIDAAFWDGLRAAAADGVDSLRHVPLDAVLLGCTSAGFTVGSSPVPAGVVTAFDALLAELARLKVQRIVLATPYPDHVTDIEAEALRAHGITVVHTASLGLTDGYPYIEPDRAAALVHAMPAYALHQADAVVLSCTGWRTLPALTALADYFDRPVLSSNSAMAAYATHLTPGATP